MTYNNYQTEDPILILPDIEIKESFVLDYINTISLEIIKD